MKKRVRVLAALALDELENSKPRPTMTTSQVTTWTSLFLCCAAGAAREVGDKLNDELSAQRCDW